MVVTERHIRNWPYVGRSSWPRSGALPGPARRHDGASRSELWGQGADHGCVPSLLLAQELVLGGGLVQGADEGFHVSLPGPHCGRRLREDSRSPTDRDAPPLRGQAPAHRWAPHQGEPLARSPGQSGHHELGRGRPHRMGEPPRRTRRRHTQRGPAGRGDHTTSSDAHREDPRVHACQQASGRSGPRPRPSLPSTTTTPNSARNSHAPLVAASLHSAPKRVNHTPTTKRRSCLMRHAKHEEQGFLWVTAEASTPGSGRRRSQ
ncbi:hypothetical protein EES41_35880 [Streptomyces sp. ADI95-16]|nr:hypothetical protein EES41_35880 [Streptomyces sp. ADI95-16]